MKLLLTVADAAEALSMSRASVYRLIARDEIPVIRIGGMTRIALSELEAFIASISTDSEGAMVHPAGAETGSIRGRVHEDQGRGLDLPSGRVGALVRRGRR